MLGNYAYVADYTSGLRIIDINNPSLPTEVGYYEGIMARRVNTYGKYIYVTDQDYGLFILEDTLAHPYSSISGYIKDSHNNNMNGVKVTLSGDFYEIYTTTGNGYYQFPKLYKNCNYILKPTKTDYIFTPPSRNITSLINDIENQNFIAVPGLINKNGMIIENEIAENVCVSSACIITVTDSTGNIKGTQIEIFAGAVSENTVLTIGKVTNSVVIPSKVKIKGSVVYFGFITESVTLNNSITIGLPYTENDTSPYALHVYNYDVTSNTWKEVPVENVDVSKKLIVFKTNQLGYYTLVSFVGDTLNNICVYPNPYKPSDGYTKVSFINLTIGTKIKIFTLSGDLVKTLEGIDGQAVWNGENENNESLSSGVYIYLISDTSGGKKTGRLAILK